MAGWNFRKKSRIKYLLLFVSLALLFYVHKQNTDVTSDSVPPAPGPAYEHQEVNILPVPHHLSARDNQPDVFDAENLLKKESLDEGFQRKRLSDSLRSKLRAQLQQQQEQGLRRNKDQNNTPLTITATAEHRFANRFAGSASNSVTSPASGSRWGELGKPVILDKEKQSPEVQALIDKGWEDNAFNQYVSDMISVSRSLPDVRDPK